MTDSVRVLVALALVGAVTAAVVVFVRSLMGMGVRGTLSVPQGKNRMGLQVQDDSKLRPYRFGQTFEAEVVPDGSDGLTLRYKGATIAAADGSDARIRALCRLADKHAHVLVSATVLGLDEQRRPLLQILLPGPSWFKRALS